MTKERAMLSTKQPQFTTSNWGGGEMRRDEKKGRGEELWKGLWKGKRDMKRVHCISKWRNTHTHTHTNGLVLSSTWYLTGA